MNHSFDVEVATKYGVNAAILLQNIHWWIEKNMANNRHFHDGRYWTYNSREAFTKLFPYLSERQIKTAMDKLITDGIIVTGDYNTDKWKRPTWYAITDKGWTFLQNGRTDGTEMSDRSNGNVSSYTDISTEDKNNSTKRKREVGDFSPGFTEFWNAYPRKVAKQNAAKAWVKTGADDSQALTDTILADVKRRLGGEWKGKEVQYIPHPTTYLNQRRWEDEPTGDRVEADEPRDLSVEEIMRRSNGDD